MSLGKMPFLWRRSLFLFMSRGDNKINVENARHFGMGL